MSQKKWIAGIALGTMLIASCADHQSESLTKTPAPQPEPEVGASRFISADGYNGEQSRGNDNFDNNATAAPEAGEDADERTVEEGDIYRVTTDGKILNLNAYRGLQIIDMTDPANPDMLGKVQMSGHPVEMYQVGSRVYALMNNWRGYYGSREDVLPDAYQGGVVVVIDISNPAAPTVTGRAEVPGWIRSSRLTRGNGQEALYVVANEYQGGGQTNVKSFSVNSTGAITAKTTLNLDGNVGDIQATGSRLMVARHDWQGQGGSDVTLIDISSPTGEMVEGDTVRVKGYVANKFNMDVHENVLRVVSGNHWNSSENTNHLETFDATDISNLTPIDSATFGDNEDLFATLFLGEKAFFVTYRRVDPFHAFEITANGMVDEKSEFIVSGWNDYFRPVNSERQLIGIGKNDENGNTMAVSLYDITDLTNPSPMLDREEVELSFSWSEANWDDRAFSVLEKATAVQAPTGETETGVVLLPFTGWDQNEYISAVQIFTFSDTTLTKRGIMEHDTPVRRSFLADATDKTVGNLSEAELALYDASAPDLPVRLGSIELAPNYSELLFYGSHAVRRKDKRSYYWWWNSSSNTAPLDELEIVPIGDDLDSAESIAEIQIPAGSTITKVGEKLVVTQRLQNSTNNDEYEVQLWNLSTPGMPTLEDSEVYTGLTTGYNDYWGWYDCFGCDYYYPYWGGQDALAVADTIVYPVSKQETQLLGTIDYVEEYPSGNYWESCYDNQTGERQDCTYFSGRYRCETLTRPDGTVEPTFCHGDFYECTQTADDTECVEVPRSTVPRETRTYSYEQNRYWTYWDFKILDVSGSTLPSATQITMANDEESVGLLVRGDSLFATYKQPYQLPNDPRPFVQYFFREIDLGGAAPVIKPDVNIPGELLEVDGNTLITRDFLWGSNIVESSINRLTRTASGAVLNDVERFEDQVIDTITLDGGSNLLFTFRQAYDYYSNNDYSVKLGIISLTGSGLNVLSETPIDSWASLRAAIPGRALFTVSGGLLVINIDDPSAPEAQSYFSTNGWPRAFITEGANAYFAAGMYGIYTFDLNESNLLVP